jgi:hypothetical protein
MPHATTEGLGHLMGWVGFCFDFGWRELESRWSVPTPASRAGLGLDGRYVSISLSVRCSYRSQRDEDHGAKHLNGGGLE